MTDDLVKRLRKGVMCGDDPIVDEAADRIEKLEEQAHYANGVAGLAMKHRDYAEQRVEKLEAALREIDEWAEEQCYVGLRKLIRKALEGKDGP